MSQEMRGALPAHVAVPASVALPFGTFERVLADTRNRGISAEIAAAKKELVSIGCRMKRHTSSTSVAHISSA